MHIQLDANDLSECISRITKVISSPSELHFVVSENKCTVSASKDGFLVSLYLKAKCLSDGECAVEFNSVKSVFRNRKTLELKLEKSQLLFKAQGSKAFAGNLVTLDYTRHKIPKLKESETISKEQVAFLSESISTLAIEDIYFKHPLSLSVFESKGNAYACVASSYHLAIAYKPLKEVVPLSLPLKCFSSIISVLSGDLKLSIDDSKVIAVNKKGDTVVNPLESIEQGPQKDSILSLVKTFSKQEPIAKKIESNSLTDIMSAFSALKTAETNIVNISADEGGLLLSMKSSKGTLNNVIKCKTKSKIKSFNVNPDMLTNFVKVSTLSNFTLYTTEKAFCLKTDRHEISVMYIGAFV